MDFKKTVIGLELGSTRIKAVLMDQSHRVLASGSFDWENSLQDGVWTYSMKEVRTGLQECFRTLKEDTKAKLGEDLTTTGAMGISAMMHGYIALDKEDQLLVPFRTWRNTMTGEAAEELTSLFSFNVPQRWSISHIYQAILNKEPHCPEVKKVATLAVYVHYLLTGEFVAGVGDASGMFPIDSSTCDYDRKMEEAFDALLKTKGISWTLRSVLPRVHKAGDKAGFLTEDGARLLDPEGTFQPGVLMVPPEGDAGTGMAATNSVGVYTGNVSAGTSDFAMVVLDHMPHVHRELDLVTTPSGEAVAMVHCNNCTTDINSWINLFGEFAEAAGMEMDKNQLFTLLYSISLKGSPDCDGLLSCNYYSGEGVTDFNSGVPFFLHRPGTPVHLASFMRTHMYSALATLKIGMDILKEENVRLDRMFGHGGYFKTPEAGQRMLSAAIDAPISVMKTAGEGGPYGMALLAAYALWNEGETLADYLGKKVFANCSVTSLMADEEEVEGFNRYIEDYKKILEVEKKAVEVL
ncbi:MAG: ATPase [Spirochaetales bacterium]|nr:ATPase [Candidatus Physcosoma equi]